MSKLYDARKLLNELAIYLDSKVVQNTLKSDASASAIVEDIKKMIERQPAVDVAEKDVGNMWIRAKDELPENTGVYLTISEHESKVRKGKRFFIGVSKYYTPVEKPEKISPKWISDQGEQQKIKSWCRIPEYEEELEVTE